MAVLLDSALDDGPVVSAWLEELVRQYRHSAQRHRHREIARHASGRHAGARDIGERTAPRRFPLGIAALLIALALALPWLLRLDRAAYPSEPDKQHALTLCSRSDPTFVRFLASDRAACYERFQGVGPAAGLLPLRQ